MAEEKTQLKWKFETGDGVLSSPAVSDDLVYFGSWDSHLYAVDIKTGKEKWKFKTGREVSSSPAVVDGVVYFGSYDKHLYAVDSKTGEEKWKFKTGDGVTPSSPAVSDGVVYFGSYDFHFYAVNIKTGGEKWKFETGDCIYSTAVSDGVVYFGSYDKHLYAVDAKTGKEKWKFKTEGEMWSDPAVSEGVVYFGSYDNHLYAVDTKTGEEKWKFETGREVSSSPAVVDGVVYFGSYDKHLYAVDIKTGKEKWKFKTGDGVSSSPAVSDGVVYFGSRDNHLYAVDSQTGKEKWKFKTGDGVNSSPAVSDGVVYFGSYDFHFYAVDIDIAQRLAPEQKIKEKEADKHGITEEDIRTKYISGEITLEEAIELQKEEEELEQKRKEEQKRQEKADKHGVTEEDIRTKYISGEITLEEAIELQKEEERMEILKYKESIRKLDEEKSKNPDTGENLKKIRELMVSRQFNAGIELALTLDDQYLLLELVEDCDIGEDGKITLNDTFAANATGVNYDILVNALFKIIRMINDIQKPDSSLKTKNIKILDLHSFVKLPAEIGVFPNLKTIFISLRHEDNVPAEYSAIDGLEIEIKMLYKRDLMRAVLNEANTAIFSQTYEIEVTHDQAWDVKGEQLEEVDPDADDYDPDGTETVRISVGDVIDYDIRPWILDQGWFDDLDSGVVSRKDIEDCIYGGLSYLCSSFRGDKIYDGEDETLYLEVETPILLMEDLNPEWIDDEYNLDDEMLADYIDDIM